MAHTDSPTVLAIAIRDKIEAVAATLGIVEVFYGSHAMITKTPAVIVLDVGKRRALAGVSSPGGRTENQLIVTIDVHNAAVGNEETERLALGTLANNIEAELHKDTTMGGIIIHGFVEEWNNGDSSIGGEFRTVQMIFVGRTKTYLSPSP